MNNQSDELSGWCNERLLVGWLDKKLCVVLHTLAAMVLSPHLIGLLHLLWELLQLFSFTLETPWQVIVYLGML